MFMFDMWVQDLKTNKCWRVTQEEGRELCNKDVARYKFYPVCPKDAPTMEIPEVDFQQMNIFDYETR